MKKIFTTILLIATFTLFMPMTPPSMAAPRPNTRTSSEFAEFPEFGRCPPGTFRVRKHSRRGRNLVNSLIAGGIGAAIGGGIGGGRGALIGLGSGTGGYLVYRYVSDHRGRCVARYVRG